MRDTRRQILIAMLITYPKIDRDAIYKRTCEKICQHEGRVLKRNISKTGTCNIGWQCSRCGALAGTWIRKDGYTSAQIAEMPQWDTEFHAGYQKDETTRYKTAIKEAEDASYWIWRGMYDRYLETAEWKAKRGQVMIRAAYNCEGCGVKSAEEVHHLTYDHCGDEFLFELVALCSPCRRRIHCERTPMPGEATLVASFETC